MTVNSVTNSRMYMSKQVTALSKKLEEKTAQLSTGSVANTYGGIGDNRLLDLELTQKVSRIDSYKETITRANLHINAMNLTLSRLEDLRLDAKQSFDPNDFELQADGQTQTQATAEILLYEAVNLLNTEVAGHYLFGGTDAQYNPVADVKDMLDGADGKDGLRTVTDEFTRANAGVNGNGRLDVSALTTNYVGITPVDSTFTIAEDGVHDFGFDIASVTNGLSNVTLTGPGGGDPDTFDVTFAGQPAVGESFSIQFTLPPNHTETFTLDMKATDADPGEGQFLIGADLEETAQNLRDAISAALEEETQTTLKAISVEWAADEFFGTYNGEVPQRVDGTPSFETATTLMSGGATTFAWYTGENTTTTNPREDKGAVIDANLKVNYGARANEEGFTDLIKSLAAFVATDFSGGTTVAEEYYNFFTKNMRQVLEPSQGTQSQIANISTEVAIAYRTVQMTDARHDQAKSSYEGTIGEIEGVDEELLAVEILQLQTNLEASYRASAIVLNLSLVNYI